jgi:hypothetical protein
LKARDLLKNNIFLKLSDNNNEDIGNPEQQESKIPLKFADINDFWKLGPGLKNELVEMTHSAEVLNFKLNPLNFRFQIPQQQISA